MCRQLTLGILEMRKADIYWAASSLSSCGGTKSFNLSAIFKCHLCIQPISLVSAVVVCLTPFFKVCLSSYTKSDSLNRLSTVWSQCCTGHVHNYCRALQKAGLNGKTNDLHGKYLKILMAYSRHPSSFSNYPLYRPSHLGGKDNVIDAFCTIE